ncbi:MAG: hypothetical protein ACYC2G_09315 [Gemmatimonadaceae bacterium]
MATTRQNAKGRRPATSAPREGPVARERRGNQTPPGGVPLRALADGVVERRRVTRRAEPATITEPRPTRPAAVAEDHLPPLLTAEEHYRVERRRRADRLTGDLAALLAEAKAEYEAQINAPRPAGKGGRPRKKVPVAVDEEDEG